MLTLRSDTAVSIATNHEKMTEVQIPSGEGALSLRLQNTSKFSRAGPDTVTQIMKVSNFPTDSGKHGKTLARSSYYALKF